MYNWPSTYVSQLEMHFLLPPPPQPLPISVAVTSVGVLVHRGTTHIVMSLAGPVVYKAMSYSSLRCHAFLSSFLMPSCHQGE